MQRNRAEVVVGSGHHGKAGVTKAAVGRRVYTAKAETRHRRRQVEVGRDGTQGSWVAGVWYVQIITAR